MMVLILSKRIFSKKRDNGEYRVGRCCKTVTSNSSTCGWSMNWIRRTNFLPSSILLPPYTSIVDPALVPAALKPMLHVAWIPEWLEQVGVQ